MIDLPRRFYTVLAAFHLFPLHAPLTLFVLDAPFGRFARSTSRFNVPGNLAWAVMELVAPITFVSTLAAAPSLTLPARILAALYLVHYAHRAVISPLLLSPPRSPLHVVVPLASALFNLWWASACWTAVAGPLALTSSNAYLLANGLAHDPPRSAQSFTKFWLPLGGWALGFVGNIYHDEVLNNLRKGEPADSHRNSGQAHGRYRIPYGGLFRFVSFPNYLCEWIEWACYAVAAAPTVLVAVPQAPIAGLPWWPTHLLAPPWMFVVAEITSMLPRAVRGHRWYHDKFDKYPRERKAVIPWLL